MTHEEMTQKLEEAVQLAVHNLINHEPIFGLKWTLHTPTIHGPAKAVISFDR